MKFEGDTVTNFKMIWELLDIRNVNFTK